MNSTLSNLQNLFRDVLDDESLVISSETKFNDINNWDSLVHITLMAAIQDEFKINIDVNKMLSVKTIGDLINIIDNRSSNI